MERHDAERALTEVLERLPQYAAPLALKRRLAASWPAEPERETSARRLRRPVVPALAAALLLALPFGWWQYDAVLDRRAGATLGAQAITDRLYGDLIGHWDKRNLKALEHTDPRALDRALLQEMGQKYGYDDIVAELRQRDGWPDPDAYKMTGGLTELDDYAACKITRKEDWRDLFVTPFYFGCEADDRVNAWAFNRRANPLGARLNAIFGSDIGHFDVPDMMDVLPEAWELVEDELITKDDFRDFTFANAVRLWGTQNPKFFEGTAVEKEAAAVLAEARATASATV